MQTSSFMERLWEHGQQHLAAMRYTAAAQSLQAAEAAAWRHKDGVALARIHLPLLEARRQIRYQAAEGKIIICNSPMTETQQQKFLRNFLHDKSLPAGTILLNATRNPRRALKWSNAIRSAAAQSGRWLESLLLIEHAHESRLTTTTEPTFAAGLPIHWTRNPAAIPGESVTTNLQIPLPGNGTFTPDNPLHVLARESLIIAWEALALKWQHRHPPQKSGGVWQEIAWLRSALQIDPACEPIAMRLIALGEAAGTRSHLMPKKRRKKSRRPRDKDEGMYICPSCGEEIIIPLDPTAGREQSYVEDCPVCCNPNLIHIESEPDWPEPRVWAEPE